MSETELQNAILQLATLCGFLAFHDNDSRRNTRGFPDLVLVHQETGRTIFAELKSDKGKARPEQRVWMGALARRNEAYVWRPADWKQGLVQQILVAERRAARNAALSRQSATIGA